MSEQKSERSVHNSINWTALIIACCLCYEFSVMLQRNHEAQNKFQEPEKNYNLLLPVVISNGQSFHKITHSIQTLDCRDYFLPISDIEKLPMYDQFVRDVKMWSKKVAEAIETAPAWEPQWLKDYSIILKPAQKVEVAKPILE